MIGKKMDSSLRLLEIYFRLNNNEKISTKDLTDQYSVSLRTIQRDIEKINSLIEPKIKKDKSSKLLSLDDKTSPLLSVEEELILNILNQACKEQGDEFHNKALNLFAKFKNSLHNTIYNNIDSEEIEDIKYLLAKVENAIYSKNKLTLDYKDKTRTVEPLKLANFQGYWYLVLNDLTDDRIKTFYFKDISNLEVLDEVFIQKDQLIERKLKNAINTYFTPDNEPYEVKLFVSTKKADIFKRKPLSRSQRVIKTYDDGSFDFSVMITNDMEIIPKIQEFIPYLKVIEDDHHAKRINDTIKENISSFL